MNQQIVEVVKSCVLVWFSVYAVWLFSGRIFFSTLPSLLIIALLLLGVYLIRIPPPNAEAVEAIVGKNPLDYEEGSNEFVMRAAAHRGAGMDAPENTLAAFKNCAEKGCNAVEFDVCLTKDNVPVIFHDDSLERLTDSTSLIKNMTWEELSQIDIGVKHPLRERFPNSHIPKLDETVQQCLGDGQRMFIDVKGSDKKIVKILIDLFANNEELYTRAVVSSFNPMIIYLTRKANPRIVCSLAHRPYVFSLESYSAQNGLGRPRSDNIFIHTGHRLLDVLWSKALPSIAYYILGISFIILHKDTISSEVVRQWQNRGVRVFTWPVNQPLEKQHFSRNLKVTYMMDTLIGEPSAHTPKH